MKGKRYVVHEEGMRWRYYMLARPFSIGAQPSGAIDFGDLDPSVTIDEIGHHAWSWVEYPNPLSEDDVRHYDLKLAFVL